jgi:hypothetical protein
MRHRLLASIGTAAIMTAVLALAPTPASGQSSVKSDDVKAYKAPRTAEGQPDLSGVWANNDATPLERPKELQGRLTLTDAEVAALSKRAGELFNGETDAAFGDEIYLAALKDAKTFSSYDKQVGNYNHFWIVDRGFDNRTALISDPPDGRVPELTDTAKKITADFLEKQRVSGGGVNGNVTPDGPEDLPLGHRCITFGVPRTGAGYNSYFQIIQSKEWVAIYQETIHDVRLIPIDNRPHIPGTIDQWLGDSRGHWEGDTLVVETKNYSDKARFRNLPMNNMTTVERFTRIGPKTVQWDVTVNDPSMYSKPWTTSIRLRTSPDQIYEFACHEGNEGLAGALSGARAQEKAAAEGAAKKGSN